MCEKHVVAQTQTDVFLASLNITDVVSSGYEIYIMATDGRVRSEGLEDPCSRRS